MKKIPQFKSEEEERDFRQSPDSTEYVDWKKAQGLTLANLKPSVKTISLRLPESMVEELMRVPSHISIKISWPFEYCGDLC